MLELKNLSVQYTKYEDAALSDINLTFKPGEFVCILGKSGAGKSTLIRCINGLQKPTRGDVFWNKQSITKLSEEQLRKVRREMGMIFQHFNLVPRLTVLQNVLTGSFGNRSTFKSLLGLFHDEEVSQAMQVIKDVGLKEQTHRKVEKLSGGQKQRVGIARALLQQPRIFLGDEPVSSLDPGTANHIFNLIQEMHSKHQLLTIINVHDVDIAKRYATRIIALKNGQVIFDDTPESFDRDQFHLTYHAFSNKLEELPIRN
ncbi:phosphonate ABC transporter ATP-binding protein [Aquibacillus salsiterrae]|uniref:Phosphonate ABC transporter ATP-binding protein n=1 Tax=Aquibacillus salsiterrae TaxID=2950439 RepID=A0A9X4AFJ9_9BACI|nr:phosphonate ABC transporter ATP-binding protein [Aquibacillus salsiterrae]MDC3417986.1 phosphonate ABC transporter ATP-binding protein [Aquibacillus salsiterrae]